MAAAYNSFYSKEQAPFNNFRRLLESELSGSFLEALKALIDQPTPKGHSTHESEYTTEASKVLFILFILKLLLFLLTTRLEIGRGTISMHAE